MTAAVSGPTITPFTSRVVNMSSSGLLLADAGGMRVGDVVSIILPGRRPVICAVARLSKSGGAGLKFESRSAANDLRY